MAILIPNRYFDSIDKAFDSNSSYEKHLLIEILPPKISEPLIESFLYEHELHNLEKEKNMFKSVHKSTFINFILVNKAIAFQNTTTTSPGLSDFHKFVLAVLKTSITKSNTQKITYIDYKTFDSVRFNEELKYV